MKARRLRKDIFHEIWEWKACKLWYWNEGKYDKFFLEYLFLLFLYHKGIDKVMMMRRHVVDDEKWKLCGDFWKRLWRAFWFSYIIISYTLSFPSYAENRTTISCSLSFIFPSYCCCPLFGSVLALIIFCSFFYLWLFPRVWGIHTVECLVVFGVICCMKL